MILALGRSRGEEVPEFLKEAFRQDASGDYATFPDFIARDLALKLIKEDPFASRVCAGTTYCTGRLTVY
jgi:hypothetical protein